MSVYPASQELGGPKTVRMEQRTTQKVKELIEQAAAALGINTSEFVVSAAAQAAQKTMRAQEATVLSKSDHAAFLQALEATEPSGRLVELMTLHSKA